MTVPHDLEPLVDIDRLAVLEFDVPTFAHDDHRFVLPLVHHGQQQRFLPTPCKIIMFDRHHDALPPRNEDAMDEIRALRRDGLDPTRLLSLVRDGLSPQDDDWIRAGMELGLFSDAVIFGTDQTLARNPFEFDDHCGQGHRIAINSGLPGECFGHQGNLSDTSRSYAVQPLWELLGWDIRAHAFVESDEKVLFDVDLDAFVMKWDEFTFAWRPEIWEKRFLAVSDYFTAAGWSGKRFVRELLDRTGMLTIAREPAGCGGEVEMQQIFRDFNRFAFDAQIGGVEG